MNLLTTLFGSQGAARCLLYLQNYGEGHARGIARTFDTSVSPVQSQLEKFEVGGVLVSRMVGNSRIYYWNDRNPLIVAIRDLLQKVLESLPDDELDKYYRERRRPRRAGKSL